MLCVIRAILVSTDECCKKYTNYISCFPMWGSPTQTSIQVVSRQYIFSGTWVFLCTNGSYVLNKTIPHTLAIHYPVYLPCNKLILSIVHIQLCYSGFERLDKEKKREIVSISFPSMETDG